jgi:hypothetical protein
MFSGSRIVSKVAALCFALVLPACAMGGGSAVPTAGPSSSGVVQTLSGGGGGGGGAQNPTAPTVDGPAWFIVNSSAVIGSATSPNVNFGALQNTVQGAISIGATRTATLLVYNTSKKTALTVSEITVTGANASDFSLVPSEVQLVLSTVIPANKSAAVLLHVTFSPTAEGARAGALRLVSNAGTVLVALTGAGLPARPILTTAGGFTFIPTSAPANFTIANDGGQTLALQSIAFGGANPGAFQLAVANHGLSNCFAGMLLGPHSFCNLAVGLAAGATAPSSAILAIQSNDPVHPETDIPLTLTP